MNKKRTIHKLSVQGELRHATLTYHHDSTYSLQRKKLDPLLYIKGLGDGGKPAGPPWS